MPGKEVNIPEKVANGKGQVDIFYFPRFLSSARGFSNPVLL